MLCTKEHMNRARVGLRTDNRLQVSKICGFDEAHAFQFCSLVPNSAINPSGLNLCEDFAVRRKFLRTGSVVVILSHMTQNVNMQDKGHGILQQSV